MALLPPADLVTMVEGQIAAELAASGWLPSRYPIDLFPADARAIAHKSYAVGLAGTVPVSGDRQRGAGVLVQTTVVVRFAWALRADGMRADYKLALGGEVALVGAVHATPRAGKLHSIILAEIPVRESLTTSEGAAGLYLGETRYLAQHRYPL